MNKSFPKEVLLVIKLIHKEKPHDKATQALIMWFFYELTNSLS